MVRKSTAGVDENAGCEVWSVDDGQERKYYAARLQDFLDPADPECTIRPGAILGIGSSEEAAVANLRAKLGK